MYVIIATYKYFCSSDHVSLFVVGCTFKTKILGNPLLILLKDQSSVCMNCRDLWQLCKDFTNMFQGTLELIVCRFVAKTEAF